MWWFSLAKKIRTWDLVIRLASNVERTKRKVLVVIKPMCHCFLLAKTAVRNWT